MKKLLSMAFLLAVAATSVMANPVPNFDRHNEKKELRKEKRKAKREFWKHAVFPATASQFAEDFPEAKNVSWNIGEFLEASFLDNGIARTAYYDHDNELVGTTTDCTAADLPLKAREHINKKYPGYKIERVVFFDDNEENPTDMFLFSRSFEDKDNYFPILTKGTRTIILKVSTEGSVSFFENYR